VAFDGTFWVIAGTAAPIIALANVVSIGDLRGLASELHYAWTPDMGYGPSNSSVQATLFGLDSWADDRTRGAGRKYWATRRAVLRMVLVSVANFVSLALVLCFSLLSVAYGRNVVPRLIATGLLTAGLAAVGWVAVRTSSAKSTAEFVKRQADLDRDLKARRRRAELADRPEGSSAAGGQHGTSPQPLEPDPPQPVPDSADDG
jgi:hypothetical protein